MNDRALNLLGLARKANRLKIGHFASKSAINNEQAKLCLLATDASERLKTEFRRLAERMNVKLYETDITIEEFAQSIGTKAAILVVTDEGFAKSIQKQIDEGQ